MARLEVMLPWPKKEQSPNFRGHWMIKSRANKAARSMAAILAIGQGVCMPNDKKLVVGLLFNPPDKRHRDWDNLVASMKAGLDGIADGLRVNDRNFRLGSIDVGAVHVGGRVVVTVEVLDA